MTFGYIYSERRKRYTIVKILENGKTKEIEVSKKGASEYEAKRKCKELNQVIEKRHWNQTSFIRTL